MYCCHYRCRCYHRLKQKNVFCSIWQTTLCKYATPKKSEQKPTIIAVINNLCSTQIILQSKNQVNANIFFSLCFFFMFGVCVCVCMYGYVCICADAQVRAFECMDLQYRKTKNENKKKDDFSWLFITLFNVLVHSVVISLVQLCFVFVGDTFYWHTHKRSHKCICMHNSLLSAFFSLLFLFLPLTHSGYCHCC